MQPTAQPQVARDHGFHRLTVRRIVRETPEACSFVLDIPGELREAFHYQSGQFVTFRLRINGEVQLRSYSMSSSPDCDEELQVAVKRVPNGLVSTFLTERLQPGDVLETTCPAGVFCLGPRESAVVAFAGGSGITPIYSILKTALATTGRAARLLYANRDQESVIFGGELENLQKTQFDRLHVVHHLDEATGLLDADTIRAFIGLDHHAEYFICGPGPFMDLIERTLHELGVDPGQIHIERFLPQEEANASAAAATEAGSITGGIPVTVVLAGTTVTTEYRPGTSILKAARQAGLQPPFSCEAGDCATCMAKIVEGTATMMVNNALTEDEVAEGWVLTCQGIPDPPGVRVVYGDDT